MVLTGNVGPKASAALQAADIAVVTGLSGTVEEAIASYLSGGHAPTAGPTVDGHSGLR